jgi:hypothetical protein
MFEQNSSAQPDPNRDTETASTHHEASNADLDVGSAAPVSVERTAKQASQIGVTSEQSLPKHAEEFQPMDSQSPQTDVNTTAIIDLSEALSSITAEIETCPRCKTPFTVGDRMCPKCGMLFKELAKTTQLSPEDARAFASSRMAGGGLFAEQRPLVFEIEGASLELPIQEELTVGRAIDSMDKDGPTVSLHQFDAAKRGVSRKHMQIRRRGPLIFVADLDSTNGTYLNGRRLQRGEERILRDGDELHLSHLLIKIRLIEID